MIGLQVRYNWLTRRAEDEVAEHRNYMIKALNSIPGLVMEYEQTAGIERWVKVSDGRRFDRWGMERWSRAWIRDVEKSMTTFVTVTRAVVQNGAVPKPEEVVRVDAGEVLLSPEDFKRNTRRSKFPEYVRAYISKTNSIANVYLNEVKAANRLHEKFFSAEN